jgi:RNA polymerase sigma-70 factor (ECF subfamily)
LFRAFLAEGRIGKLCGAENDFSYSDSIMAASDHPTSVSQRLTSPLSGDDGAALEEVVAGCQRSDPVMQRELYDRSHQQLFRLAVRMVGRQDAADVCQQIFLNAFKAIREFTGRSNVMTWLYRIAVNECLQYRRKRGRRPTLHLADYEPPDHRTPEIARTQQRELLEKALERIDPDLRCVFLLRELDGLSYAQISEVMELPEGTVASRLSRAREQLQEILTALET